MTYIALLGVTLIILIKVGGYQKSTIRSSVNREGSHAHDMTSFNRGYKR